MNHKEKLLEIYNNSFTIDDIILDDSILDFVNYVGKNIESQKGVFTVLITLGIHKLLHEEQDIRLHQDNMNGGFSGRSLDTKYITPTLKSLGLTSMSESGWLTRSLEQPYPYDKNYNGKISNTNVKKSFLEIVDFIQNSPSIYTEEVLRVLLNYCIQIRENNKVEIKKIDNPESLTIDIILNLLSTYFHQNYKIPGGSKLPVISFYTIYEILVVELKRFEECELIEMGFHTTSDKTSKSSGDIEVFKNGNVYESLEIKYGIFIDSHIINRVIEKIIKYNPKRYYVLTTEGIVEDEKVEILSKIKKLREEHGCQLIVNGLLPTLKYYLRLISDLNEFLDKFTLNVLKDTELKIVHKEKWKELIESI